MQMESVIQLKINENMIIFDSPGQAWGATNRLFPSKIVMIFSPKFQDYF
jgi:hypothetical protein